MNLGQMWLAAGALALLGMMLLNSNSSVISSNQVLTDSEFNVTAVSLATSVTEEAMGKVFDVSVKNPNADLSNPASFTPPPLGPEPGESYAGLSRFDDFDDFNGLFLEYRSDNPRDSAVTPGVNSSIVIPGIRSRYFVRCSVDYVHPDHLGDASPSQTFHKRLVVTVTRPKLRSGPPEAQLQDSITNTVLLPTVMSFWR